MPKDHNLSLDASAGGKLVIAGEYAVLLGCEAWVMPTLARAHVRIETMQASASSGLMTLKNYKTHPRKSPLSKHLISKSIEWGWLNEKKLSLDYELTFDFQSSEFTHGDTKLGLGSSSALTLAWVRALRAYHESLKDSQHQKRFESEAKHAYQLHDSFGGGSGIDIAQALSEKPILFSMTHDSDGKVLRRIKDAPPLAFPWRPLTFFVGHAQNTRPFVRAFEHAYRHQKNKVDTAIREIRESSQGMIDLAFQGDDFSHFLEHVSRHAAAMSELGMHIDVDIVSHEHQEIIRWAKAHGGAAKPSGAGGGDIALAWIPQEHLSSALSTCPLKPMELLK